MVESREPNVRKNSEELINFSELPRDKACQDGRICIGRLFMGAAPQMKWAPDRLHRGGSHEDFPWNQTCFRGSFIFSAFFSEIVLLMRVRLRHYATRRQFSDA